MGVEAYAAHAQTQPYASIRQAHAWHRAHQTVQGRCVVMTAAVDLVDPAPLVIHAVVLYVKTISYVRRIALEKRVVMMVAAVLAGRVLMHCFVIAVSVEPVDQTVSTVYAAMTAAMARVVRVLKIACAMIRQADVCHIG